MKVMVVHNSYQMRGGEDAVVANEIALLRAGGQHVIEYRVSNDSIRGLWGAVRVALGTAFSPVQYLKLLRAFNAERPDLVHVHNFFPRISPAVFYACSKARIPVVLTLHNFRIVCPTALLMHDGRIEERSIAQGPWWAVAARAYRGSVLGTAVLAAMIWIHRRIGTWRRHVNRFVVLTEFARSKFAEAGLPREKLVVKPNFTQSSCNERSKKGDRPRFLFVGRLSPEKGVAVLSRASAMLPAEAVIDVVGDGPEAHLLAGNRRVVCHGHQPAEKVRELMLRATALVVPSLWYEGFPMVVVEALACGLPVVASRLGALAEIVEDGVVGLQFEAGDANDLVSKLQMLVTTPGLADRLSAGALKVFGERYTPEQNYKQLMETYTTAITGRRER